MIHARVWNGYDLSQWRRRTGGAPNVLPLATICGIVAWMIYRAVLPDFTPGPTDVPQSVRDRAALLFAICWLPAIRYVTTPTSQRRPIPFLSLYGAFYSLYYAAAVMFGRANLLSLGPNRQLADPAHDYSDPVDLLLAGFVLLIVGYVLVPRIRLRWRGGLSERLARLTVAGVTPWALALLAIGAVSQLLQWRDWWPTGLGGLANLLTLLMEASLVFLVACWRRGKLSRRAAGALAFGATAAVAMMLGGGVTTQVLFALFAMFVGAWLGRPSLPVRYLVAGAVLVAACVAVRGVTTKFREAVWWGDRGTASSIERARFMADLLGRELKEEGPLDAVGQGWHVISYRSSNIDLLIDVMHRTPAEIPYWEGATYRSLVGSFVPRFLWPDKPVKALGQAFGHRYQYLAESDHQTSINLPVIVEFYINYSTPGVFIGMFVLGVLLRVVEEFINRPGQSLLISAAAAPLLARMLVMECDLSLTFGGIPMQVVTLWLLATALLSIEGAGLRRGSLRPPWYASLPRAESRSRRWCRQRGDSFAGGGGSQANPA